MGVSLRAPAKLNLGLRVLERRPDGYHEIETIFLPLDLCDEIELELRSDAGIELEVEGAALPAGSDNLAVRAAERACRALGVPPALSIRLRKRIPVGAGLGGGSSDAAAVLLGVEELAATRLPPQERHALAVGLGADVPFFLRPTPSLGRGIGDLLTPLSGVPALWWVLVAFPFEVSTPAVYRAASAELTLPRQGSSIAALLGTSGVVSPPPNDLESVTSRWHPEIRAAKTLLHDLGARITGMSGSGPTVFGNLESRQQAERVATETRERLPETRVLVAGSAASES